MQGCSNVTWVGENDRNVTSAVKFHPSRHSLGLRTISFVDISLQMQYTYGAFIEWSGVRRCRGLHIIPVEQPVEAEQQKQAYEK
jgi:hypothetical protein